MTEDSPNDWSTTQHPDKNHPLEAILTYKMLQTQLNAQK